MSAPTLDQLAVQTMERLGSEFAGTAYLSADIVATDEDGNPVVSVIHLDDRRHWNLVVRKVTGRSPHPGDVSATTTLDQLPDTLDAARDGELILVADQGWLWTLDVEVLDPAPV